MHCAAQLRPRQATPPPSDQHEGGDQQAGGAGPPGGTSRAKRYNRFIPSLGVPLRLE
jgi:hypothetical protein